MPLDYHKIVKGHHDQVVSLKRIQGVWNMTCGDDGGSDLVKTCLRLSASYSILSPHKKI